MAKLAKLGEMGVIGESGLKLAQITVRWIVLKQKSLIFYMPLVYDSQVVQYVKWGF